MRNVPTFSAFIAGIALGAAALSLSAQTTPADATNTPALAGAASGNVTGNATAAAAAPSKPKVYALIAAVGNQITLVRQENGTPFMPTRSTKVEVPNDALNRAALIGLNDAIAGADPGSKRLFLNLPASALHSVSNYESEEVAINDVIDVLKTMPQRMEWDSIVIATPSYKAFELNGAPGRMAGFGVYYQGLASNRGAFRIPGADIADFEGVDGADVKTPEGKFVRNERYVAPMSFIEVWVLDPKTLKVLDRQKRFDNQKLWDPFGPKNIAYNIDGTVLMKNFASLIERSVAAAVDHSDILNRRGVVDVGKVREGKPEDKN